VSSNSAFPDIRGWILDALPVDDGMRLWLLSESGQRLPVVFPFSPCLYLSGKPELLQAVPLQLKKSGIGASHRTTEKTDLMSGSSLTVLEICIDSPPVFPAAVAFLLENCRTLAFYNCDIALPQMFFYTTGLFPLAFCGFSLDKTGRIRESACLDSPWDTGYRLPELRTITLSPAEGDGNPRHRPPVSLAVGTSDGVRILDGDNPALLIESLNRRIRKEDPDLILSDWGDDWIFPGLGILSGRTSIPLELSRAPTSGAKKRTAQSWFSYGRVHFRPEPFLLSGRWHVDRRNSFIVREAGLEGLFEQSRITRIPVQEMARTSTGAGITSLQLEHATRRGILIPRHKSEPESFGTALDLLAEDKGGMVFLPPPGFHESVAELDFASMYPSLMVRFNISPETVGCHCCPENRVPGTRHTLCTRRKGFIPEVLQPLLGKRQAYKENLARLPPSLRRDHPDSLRQKALKWLLVVSFGYLGYKNARFGKIEAHECVTAYGREVLLRAKELAENRGYRLLHGIVDSLWLQKEGLNEEDCLRLAQEVGEETGIPLNLEGIYRWIGFFPSRQHPSLSVPNRFLGVFQTGEIKMRGLEARRSDTPPLIRHVQSRMVEILSQARNMEEYRALIPKAREAFEDGWLRLSEGRVPMEELVFRKTLSKPPDGYGRGTLTASVARELSGRGIRIKAGETVRYVITNAQDRDPSRRARAYPLETPDATYDRQKYQDLLRKAAEPLLEPLILPPP
jgi:DNA polymerase elongation subunit (family B)